jgi:hypothetical protein
MVAVRRAGTTAWRVRRLAPHSVTFAFGLTCGVDDAGGVVAAWEPDAEPGGTVEAVTAPYDGPIESIQRFGDAGVSDPHLAVAPDGGALLAYGRNDPGPGDSGLLVAERPPGAAFGRAAAVDEGAIGGAVVQADPSGAFTLAWVRAAPRALRIATKRIGTEPIVQDIPGTYGARQILHAGQWSLLTVGQGAWGEVPRTGVSLRAPGQAAWPPPVLRPRALPGSPTAIAADGTVLEAWWTGRSSGRDSPPAFGRVRAAVVHPDGTREPAPRRISPRQPEGVYYEGLGSAAGLALVWTQAKSRAARVERVRIAAYR